VDAYTEIARLLGPRPVRPWLWTVVPKMAGKSSVGLGVSDSEARARAAVEDIMAKYPGAAAFGALEGPATKERCLRNANGGFTWVECR
jgi:hypothetical protein